MLSKSVAGQKFIEAIKRWNLWDKDEPVLVAVSGGIDSNCLLHMLLHLPKPLRPKVHVAHYEHGLRAEESLKDAQLVQSLAQEWGVPFSMGTAPAWTNKKNIQERARKLRYEFFVQIARQFKIKKLLTAHHAGDQVETFLMRFLQGSSLKGLSGIPFSRVMADLELVRPLLFVTRPEIDAYVQKFKVTFREDLSNRDPHYMRSRMRKLSALLYEENPRLGALTTETSILLQADEHYCDEEAEKYVQKKMSIKTYQALPASIRYRLLQKMIKQASGESVRCPAQRVLEMDYLLFQPGPKKLNLGRGLAFCKGKTHYSLEKKKEIRSS